MTQSLTTMLALGGLDSSCTCRQNISYTKKIKKTRRAFIRKKVMEVRRSTVDLRSINFSLLEAGKLLRYMERSMRKELCNWSSSLTNFSLPKLEAAKRSLAETALDAVVCA